MKKIALTILFVIISVLFTTENLLAATVSAPTFLSGMGLNQGLIGYWGFDGKDTDFPGGTTANKVSASSPGTLTNMSATSTPIPGKIGQGLSFDGIDDEVAITSAGAFNPSTITFSFWIFTPINVSTSNNTIIERGGNTGYRVHCATLTPCTPQITFNSTSGAQAPAITRGKWNHVVITASSTGSLGYTNGVPGTLDADAYVAAASSGNLRIGTGALGSFNGFLDDMRIYDRALSTLEIRQLYAAGFTKVDITPPLVGTTGCTNTLSCGLVGYWTFDGKDMLNGRVLDLSGNANHGTPTSIATSSFYSIPGKMGQALTFDAIDDKVDAGSGTSLDNIATTNGGFTASLWVKARGYGGSNTGILISKETSSSGGAGWFLNLSGPNSNIRFNAAYNTTNLNVLTSLNTFTTNDFGKWVHLVVTWDGSATASNVHIYKNGTELTYATQTNGVTTYNSDAARNFVIGGGDVTSGRNANASIDDVRVYNRILSAAQITQIYNQGAYAKIAASPRVLPTTGCSSGLSCGLLGYWSFDGKDVPAGVPRDISGNGNHGSLNSIATTTFYVPGKVGQGFNFDGVDDYVQSSTINGSSLTSTSFAFWFKSNTTSAVQAISWGSLACTLNEQTTNKINCYVDGSSAASAVSSQNVNDGKWHHAVLTSSGSSQVLYVDGVSAGSASETFSAPNSVVRIGRAQGAGTAYFPGMIDDVRVYNRALSSIEAQQLYSIGK